MSKRRYTLLRAVAELVNAANGVQPIAREGYPTIRVFAFGWPTSEMSPVYMGVSMLDALRRGLRGDFRGARGRIALVLTAIAWALLYLIHRRNVRIGTALRGAAARRRSATTTSRSPPSRSPRGAVAPGSASGRPIWSAGATSRRPAPCSTVRIAG